MKTIVDTSVWSLAFRRRDPALLSQTERQLVAHLRSEIENNKAAILGPIRQEILSGIRDQTKFAGTKELLDPFLDEEIIGEDYIEAARLFNLCRAQGIQCGPVDILVCAVALRLKFKVLTNDTGILRCIETLRSEGLSI